jgi:cytochrome c-type biogenesis protein CcmH
VRRAAALFVALAALAAAVPAGAAVELTDVEDEVMCPVCGTPLNVAKAPQADREREYIRGLIAQGKTKEQIKDALVAEFGSGVLALPDEDEGVGFAAYAVPIALVAILVALLAVFVPRWRRRAPAPGAAAPELSPAERARVDEELARFER